MSDKIFWKKHEFIMHRRERDFFIDNLLVRIHFIIVMIGWTGLAPWELEFAFREALHLPFQPRVNDTQDPTVGDTVGTLKCVPRTLKRATRD